MQKRSMISHQYKCIFVHIPKCGGTSIEDIIWPRPRRESDLWMGFINKYENKYQTGGLQHLLARQIRQEVGDTIFNDYFKFSFTRNPWDKAVSQYSYLKGRKDLQEFLGMAKDDSFKKYLELTQTKRHVQWEPQYQFVCDGNGDFIVDFIGKLENFATDVPVVLHRLGMEGTFIPHSKKSQRTAYPDYYDSESIEMVREAYKRDIELFGYSFAGEK